MKNKIGSSLMNLLIGILFTLFFASLSTGILLNFRPLYYWDISHLGISGAAGLTDVQIRNNYDALIDYNSPFFFGSLEFPDLPSSEEGLIHFTEVKQIFMTLFLVGTISLILLFLLLRRKKHAAAPPTYLRTAALTTILLPLAAGLAVALNFDKAFVAFHKLFFRNDYWLFDYETDPIILLLPDTFFLQCAAGIILLMLLGSAILFILYFIRRPRSHKNPLDPAEP